ncbi:MAG: phosphatidylserine decarboxylase family protein [Nitrospinota bacterium]|nr:phosphatidylserine decarboxylase family protein [Nitrospinota bacterium]
MKIASDAWMFVIPLLLGGGIVYATGYRGASLVFIALALFVMFFFRDPEREIPQDANGIVSPADGTIVRIDHDWLDDSTGEKKTRVSIFLSIFNVHINRYPIAGKVIKKEFINGKFLAAFNHMASEENSRTVVVIDTPYGKVTIKQIVGLIARRIVCSTNVGDTVAKGERFGLMRFGSRMDVIFPSTAEVKVKLKDKVQGGISTIAILAK